MILFSIDVVANGQPRASIASRASFCNPSREIVKAGNATTDFALFTRSVMAATAFCRDVSLDFSVRGRTSVGVTGVGIIRWNDDVSRLTVAPSLCDDAFHFYHAVIRIDHRVRAGRLRRDVDELVKNSVAESVVHRFAQALILI